ncbi:hypothetical protein ES702_06166 [subsurface metagenome]
MKIKINGKLISEIGVREKYIRKNHYNSIKVWWARRPITAMRALLMLEMYSRKKEIAEVEYDLISEINPTEKLLEKFSSKFKTRNIKVLDVFAGGGAIPFESSRLGFHTLSAELNPVASLLQETIFNSLEIAEYSSKLRLVGERIIGRLKNKYSKYYDLNGNIPYVIYCSKVAKCSKCKNDIDLRRLKYLKKKKNEAIIIDENGDLKTSISYIKNDEKRKTFKCSNCGNENSFKEIKEYCELHTLDYKPFAICYHNETKKTYRKINDKDRTILNQYKKEIQEKVQQMQHLLPDEKVTEKGGVINPTLYDLKKPEDFFSDRQKLILLGLINEIIEEYKNLINDYGKKEAKQLVNGLTPLIEFLIDWNSTGTMWISQNEQTGRSLAGPGVGMKWDFIEINPFYKIGSNLKSKLYRVCDTFKAIENKNKVEIIRGSSTNLPLKNESIDIVLTDPPYYDSIDYTGLSEFFRPWLEIVIRNTYDDNINLENDHKLEAIVDLSNGNKNGKNEEHYKNLMTGVLKEVQRVLKPDGTVLFLYSHKTFEGWKVIGEAIKDAKLFIEECLPLEMERIARPRAMSYEALNGVIVFKIKKDKNHIKNIKTNIEDLDKEIRDGQILDSHKVIYMAALACKEMTLTNKTYDAAYKEAIKYYSKVSINRDKIGFDSITKAYISKYLEEINVDYELLQQNGLINENSKSLLQINNMTLNKLDSGSQLYMVKKIYDEFKNNSKTKVEIDKTEREVLIQVFSMLSGLNLNTVSQRSSNEIVKVSRLVLSKI